MKKYIFLLFLLPFMTVQVYAECYLDHFIVGVNEDGIMDTEDDNKLFVDCNQKYRSTGSSSHEKWYYPMSLSYFSDWRIGEPGFDQFQGTNLSETYSYDPNRCPDGEPEQDYDIIIECISISPSLKVVPEDPYWPTIDEAGECLDYSGLHAYRNNPHTHMSYRADDPNMCWVTFQLHDEMETYESSEPFTVVFNAEPLAGDLVVDGLVNENDLYEFCYYWLRNEGSTFNDYYERADANRNGSVNLSDFSMFASNWLKQQE